MKIMTHDWHESRGAVFEDFFAAQIPSNYGNIEDEYWLLRKSAAVRDVSHFGKIKITGMDAKMFLHRMISSDVKSLAPGQGVWSLFLDVKGHIQADFKLYEFPDFLLMILQRHLLDRITKGLDRYIISEQVSMKDVSDEYAMFQVLGPQGASELTAKGVSKLPDRNLAFESASIGGVDCSVIRLGAGYALLCNSSDASALLNSLSLPPIGMRAFDIFRIEQGLALSGVDFDDTNLPQEARLDGALNFQKGCYLGQEVMARLDAQGHVNRMMMGITSSQPLNAGDKIYKGDKEIGRITSAAHSPLSNGHVALGYVRREAANEAEEVVCGENRTISIVRKLPIVA
jgi:folate-binding protein YgfZ